MIGAIAGDMIGSPYEAHPKKNTDIPMRVERFTDDTVLTVAVAHAILTGEDYAECLKRFAQRHPGAGYGGTFLHWMWLPQTRPYNSWGNGSAMRVSPVGFAFDTEETVLAEARRSAEVTHNHPEGIKGAQATALAIWLARHAADKKTIRSEIKARFGYDLDRRLSDIRPAYGFDISCQGSVPESMIAFLESHDYESTVRNAISLGGDADTMACIAGGIAQAFYRVVPADIVSTVRQQLPEDLLAVVDRFEQEFKCPF
ncbi:ADP-ribosylglycohydrolase [Desulfosarcina variabilis str. Montpellier]|jgi:ADP-ribosylglycohydrolase|uniref:ADP-ribosylglycohydrolase family protein n=1 Tax=Desulfosarcina variabilis TaxID=2300 RepID=UPI003AFB4D78